MNPYESPQSNERYKKRKEPLVDWGLLGFVSIVGAASFVIFMVMQYLIEYLWTM